MRTSGIFCGRELPKNIWNSILLQVFKALSETMRIYSDRCLFRPNNYLVKLPMPFWEPICVLKETNFRNSFLWASLGIKRMKRWRDQIKIKDVCLTLYLKTLNEFHILLWKQKSYCWRETSLIVFFLKNSKL